MGLLIVNWNIDRSKYMYIRPLVFPEYMYMWIPPVSQPTVLYWIQKLERKKLNRARKAADGPHVCQILLHYVASV